MDVTTIGLGIAAGSAAIGAGIAVGAAGIGTGIGQGHAVQGALEGMARNPEMEGTLRTNMFVGAALAESSAIYGLIIALVLIGTAVLPAINALV